MAARKPLVMAAGVLREIPAVDNLTVADLAMTGTPTAPTAAPGTNTTQVATTAFVQQELAGAGGGPPSGSAGGVLSGTYPNPGFAEDMATQAELSAMQSALQANIDGKATIGLIVPNSKSTNYTLVAADVGKMELHPGTDATARTFTIPANASVAFPIGTALTFVNQHGAGVLTIAITSDTMRLAVAGTTGSRTLAANGVATALKLAATEWLISGVGLT